MDTDTLRCLDCGSRMIEETHHGVVLDRCAACDGLWFDVDEIYDYLRAHPAVAVVHEPLETDFRQCTKGVGSRCNCCGENAVELGDFRGIAYQRCTWCGGLFIGRHQISEIVASRVGQVTTWGPEGEFNSEPYVVGAAAAVAVSDAEQTRSAGDRIAEGVGTAAEGGLEVGAHAVLEGGGELAGAAVELVVEFVFGIIAGAFGG